MASVRGIYEMTKTGNSLNILFSSTMDHIDDVCRSVTLFLENRGDLYSSHLFSINLVMREGLTNAVRHGNKGDPDKLVSMDLHIDPDQVIRVSIADQGEGFDWQKIRDTPAPDEADHGRGMPIMQTYFTRCRYNQKGNILYLEKQILSQV